MNTFVITGRFTRDIELRTTKSEKTVANVTIASDRKRDRSKTDFFPVTLWEGLAKTCAEHSGKGRLVCITGRVQHSVTGPEGEKRHHYDWIAEDVEFLDSKPTDDIAAEQASEPEPEPATA